MKNNMTRLLFLGMICIITSLAVIYYSHIRVHDSSTTGEEIAELSQNTIPIDVQNWLNQQTHVLGTKTTTHTHTPPLSDTVRVPILLYHYIEYVQDPNDKMRIALNTTPYTLEQQIKTLQQAHYTLMTTAELIDVMDDNKVLPSKPIVLTFDDGYRDFYTDAYPILEKYHAKATQYVISGFLDRPNHLTTAQLQEIAKNNLIEIGAHTVHHVWLKGQSNSIDQYETATSKKTLEDIIHKPVISFAYPFGAFDIQAIDAVENAGFTSAVSTIPGILQRQPQRFFLYRLRAGGRTGKDLLTWLDTL